MAKSRSVVWRIIAKPSGDIFVYGDSKFRTFNSKYLQIEEYLFEWVKPQDVITFVGFRKEDIEVSGEKFLKEYNA